MAVAASSIGALLIAAGGSTRLGQPKQLVDVRGEPMVRRQARLLLALQPACVVVVTGAAGTDVAAAVNGLEVTRIHNPDWAEGMGRSIACGIRAMPERVRGALLLLVDQYRLEAEDLHALIERWSEDPQSVALAGWDGERGPPTLFPRSLFERLSRLSGDQGARPVLKRFRGRQQVVPLPNAAVDLDTAADLARMQSSQAPRGGDPGSE